MIWTHKTELMEIYINLDRVNSFDVIKMSKIQERKWILRVRSTGISFDYHLEKEIVKSFIKKYMANVVMREEQSWESIRDA